MYENLKPYLVALLTSVIAVINPIKGVLWVLSATFIINIATGIIADIHVNKAAFSIGKGFSAFFQMALIMALVYYIQGSFMQLKMETTGQEIVKWIAILALYFYSTNISRNASLIYPGNKFFSFLYEVLTTQIFTRIKRALFMDIKK